MIVKVIARGPDRNTALTRLHSALSDLQVSWACRETGLQAFICQCFCPQICLSTDVFVCLSVLLSVCLWVHVPDTLSHSQWTFVVYAVVCQSCLSVCVCVPAWHNSVLDRPNWN